jgi:hypothetical protein
MKKILILVILVVIVTASLAFARSVMARNLPAITAANKLDYKNMLKNYLMPINNGYGIGFSGDNYITARWYITSVKTLNITLIKEIVSNSNATEWSQLRQQIQNALQTQGQTTTKGRISIGKTIYILTDISVSNSTATSNIRQMPDYSSCTSQNISAEQCESAAALVGDFSLSKKTNALNTTTNEQVWAGTLDFNSVSYTFMTFSYPGALR